MDDAWLVEERAADAWFEPASICLAELARGKCEIDLLRGMLMVGITHVRREQAHTHPSVVPVLDPAGPGDHGVGVSVHEVDAGE